MKRNLVTTILLMIFTCGLYYLYLIFAISKEMNELQYDYRNDPAMDLLLSVITCGIYHIYWYYKIVKQIENLQYDLGMRASSLSLLCPILAVLQLSFISMLILVSEMNHCIDEKEYY